MEKNNFKFSVVWSSCIFVLLLMVGLGVSSSAKGTRSAESVVDKVYSCTDVTAGKYGATTLNDDRCVVSFTHEDTIDYENTSAICYNEIGNVWSGSCDKTASSSGYTYSCSCSRLAEEVCPEGYIANIWGNCILEVSEDDSCPSGQIMTEDGCVSEEGDSSSTVTEKCFQCNSPDTIYHWGTSYSGGSSECQSGWHEINLEQSQCVTVTKKCYECNGTSGLRYWGIGTSGAPSCGGGWHERTDLTDQESCEAVPTYTITYNANGGSSAPSSQTKIHDVDLTLEGAASHSETCYKFMGWAYGSNITSVTYQPGDTYTSNSAATFHAVWDDSSCDTNTGTEDDGNPGTTPGSGGNGGGNAPTSQPTSKPTSQPTSAPTSTPDVDEPSSEENVDENPPTGEIAIFVVWVVAAAAIVYSVWYFKQVRES